MKCASCGVFLDKDYAIDLHSIDSIEVKEENTMQASLVEEDNESFLCEDCFNRLKGD